MSVYTLACVATKGNLRVRQRCAVEAVIWGMPAVNFDLLYQAMAQAGGAWNQIVHWSRPFDWRGSITGSVDVAWQTALEDLGPAGVDKGNGGKCLILPPGYQGKVLDAYIPMPSNTYRSYAVQCSNLPVVGKTISPRRSPTASGSSYTLSHRRLTRRRRYSSTPPIWSMTTPSRYDLRFFQSLDRSVQIEPWLGGAGRFFHHREPTRFDEYVKSEQPTAPVGAGASPMKGADVVMRSDAYIAAAASALIMGGPGLLVRTRRNRRAISA